MHTYIYIHTHTHIYIYTHTYKYMHTIKPTFNLPPPPTPPPHNHLSQQAPPTLRIREHALDITERKRELQRATVADLIV